MKISRNFVLKKIGDESVVIPLGSEAINLGGVLTLNETGVMLYEMLKDNKEILELVDALVEAYNVSREQAMNDVLEFIEKLKELGILDV